MKQVPDDKGRFGSFGGKYVIETLIPALEELERVYLDVKESTTFQEELKYYLRHYVGRPSELFFAENLTKSFLKAIFKNALLKNNTAEDVHLVRVLQSHALIAYDCF